MKLVSLLERLEYTCLQGTTDQEVIPGCFFPVYIYLKDLKNPTCCKTSLILIASLLYRRLSGVSNILGIFNALCY